MAAEIDGTSKGLLGAFAIFTLGSGIASLGYGILLLLRYMGVDYHYGAFNLFSTSILLIVVGGLLIIAVILGVIGALKDVSNVRLVTLVLVFILFAVLAAVGIWGMVLYKTGRLEKSINEEIGPFGAGKYNELTPELKKKADYLNRHYNCCGVYDTYETRVHDVFIPDSCCVTQGCVNNQSNYPGKYFEKGCASVYLETKSKAVFHLAILALAAAGVVLIALILYGVVSRRAGAGYAPVSRG